MPTIHVEMFAGRTLEQKRALAQALTEATVQTLGGSAASIDVIFTDIQRHDWATGGKLWSDAVPAAAPPPKAKAHSAAKSTSVKTAAKSASKQRAKKV
jgi:4-oxalocrotonate tautomerase